MPPRAGLDRAAIVNAAARLVNSQGAQALTLNRLALELGVKTPSLYNHIDGLPGLYRELTLMNARGFSTALADAAIGKSGAQALRAMAQAARVYIKSYSGLYLAGLRASRNFPSSGDPTRTFQHDLQEAEARGVAAVMTVVASFGLTGDDGLHAVRGLRSLVHGFATLEISGGFGLPLDCDESFRRLVELFIHGLQPLATGEKKDS